MRDTGLTIRRTVAVLVIVIDGRIFGAIEELFRKAQEALEDSLKRYTPENIVRSIEERS